jgi:hypothetical protein
MTVIDHHDIAVAINGVLGRYHEWAVGNVAKEVVEALSDVLENDDPEFERKQFLRECGIEAAK